MTTPPPATQLTSLPPSPSPLHDLSAPASFRSHLSRGLSVASRVALAASTVIPGAGLVSLALGGISRLLGSNRGGATATLSGQADALGGGLEGYLAGSRSLNSRYLLLQEAMAREARTFTALSNIMKARHDAASNAIANIR